VSALAVADEVLKVLVAQYPATPEPQWAQLGGPILTCTSTAVGAISSSELPLFPDNAKCGSIDNHTLMLVIARECGITFDQEGRTVPSKIEAVSRTMETDAEAFDGVLDTLTGAERVIGVPSISYLNEGGLAITSMTIIVTES
jgi:hypothetical protein